MRLGDLDALKENIKNAFKHNFNGNDALLVNEIYEFIDNAPTVAYPFDKFRTMLCGTCQAHMRIESDKPQGDIFPMELVAGKCPIEADGNCPLKSQGEENDD
jgi:hypothetical protein